jgi:hypothetical protein
MLHFDSLNNGNTMRNYSKRYIYAGGLLLLMGLIACKKEFNSVQPLYLVNNVGQLSSVAGIMEATDGNYLNLLNDGQAMQGAQNIGVGTYESALFVIGETRGNNLVPINPGNNIMSVDAYNYTNSGLSTAGYSSMYWRSSYQLIVSINAVLEGITAFIGSGQFGSLSTAEQNEVIHAEGENLFLRGLVYFTLVRVYGMPYYNNASTNLGVALKTSTDITDLPPRSTVAQTYQMVIQDLQNASALMNGTGTPANTFASTSAAQALLSRVYLYMGGTFTSPGAQFNQSAVNYADSVIQSGTYSLTQGQAYVNMFAFDSTGALGRVNVNANQEVIFADDHSAGNSGIEAFLYLTGSVQPTWVNFLVSPSYRALLATGDLRARFFRTDEFGYTETTKYSVIPTDNGLFGSAPFIYLRLAEVYLNRAEAEVKLGDNTDALSDLNIIHTRAGLTALTGLTGSGLFNAILDERRLELAFEADCGYDYFRNGLPMVRPSSDTGGSPFTVNATDNKVVMQLPFSDIISDPVLVQNPQ